MVCSASPKPHESPEETIGKGERRKRHNTDTSKCPGILPFIAIVNSEELHIECGARLMHTIYHSIPGLWGMRQHKVLPNGAACSGWHGSEGLRMLTL